MKQTLDDVIRIVDETEAKSFIPSATKKLIFIDRKEGKALDKKPLFDLRGSLVRHIVCNENGSDNVAKSEISNRKIEDKKGNLAIGFALAYTVRCPVGNESRVAERLFDVEGKNPSSVLEEHLVRAMNAFMEERYQQNPIAFCKEYPRSKEHMQDYIEKRINTNIGLRIESIVKLDYEDKVQDIKVDKHTSVMSCDCEEYLKLHIQANLTIDEENKIYAIIHYPNRSHLEILVEKDIQVWIRKNGNMHDVVYDSPILKSQLITHLNMTLSSYGRKVDFLTLNPDITVRMPEFKPFRHDIVAEIRQYGEVTVENQFDVEPIRKNIITYRSMGFHTPADVESYLKLSLSRIIEKELFNLSYIKVLTNLDKFQRDVRQQFQETANQLGYDVKLFSSIPDLEPIRLVNEGFTISLSDGGSNTEFSTSFNFIKVKLDVRLSGKLQDLKIIENHLVARTDLRDLMRARIRNILEEMLLVTTPNEFYLHFEQGENQQESVRSKIINTLSKILCVEFGISISNLIPILLETDLQRSMFSLLKERGNFSVNMSSLRDNEDEYTLTGDFRVINIDPNNFQVFLMQPASIEVIQEKLARSLASRLNMLSMDQQVFFDIGHFDEMLKIVQKMSYDFMAKQFGIIVIVDSISRERTNIEKALLQENIDDKLSQIEQIKADKHNLREIKKLEVVNRFNDLTAKQEDISVIRESIRSLQANTFTSPEELEILQQREEKLVQERDALEEEIRKQVSVSDQSLRSLSARPERTDNQIGAFMPSLSHFLIEEKKEEA
jgi:hypothetical protein